jgi:hypothetical protein
MKTYGPFALNDFRPGNRVEIHPALDLWMRGDRYGKIAAIGRKHLHVRMDISGIRLVRPENIYAVIE